jgi:hypothetical protein
MERNVPWPSLPAGKLSYVLSYPGQTIWPKSYGKEAQIKTEYFPKSVQIFQPE